MQRCTEFLRRNFITYRVDQNTSLATNTLPWHNPLSPRNDQSNFVAKQGGGCDIGLSPHKAVKTETVAKLAVPDKAKQKREPKTRSFEITVFCCKVQLLKFLTQRSTPRFFTRSGINLCSGESLQKHEAYSSITNTKTECFPYKK